MPEEELVKQVAERVRQAIAAAETRADEIVRDAEAKAERIRAEAEDLASRARSDAEVAARRRLDEVRSALDALESRLGAASEVEPGPVTVPEPEPPMTPEPAPQPVPEPTPDPVPEPIPPPDEGDRPSAGGGGGRNAAPSTDDLLAQLKAGAALAGQPGPAPTDRSGEAAGEGPGVDAAARLVAMKLALDGTPREEARTQLSADYDLADLEGLLDEVYAKAGR